MALPLDALILGPFVFTDFAVPERLPLGGRQQLHVHKLPGGARIIDAMGPDDDDREWTGTFFDSAALGKALTLDAMRRSGAELPYSNGAESRTVVISHFSYMIRRYNWIEYHISVTTSDDSGATSGLSSITSMIIGDLSAAVALVQ